MSQINEEWADRDGKISEAIEEVGIGNLEAKLGELNVIPAGIVHREFYDGDTRVGYIIYDGKQPKMHICEDSFEPIAEKLMKYFRAHL